MLTRRRFLGSIGAGVVAAGGFRLWPEDGLWHECGPVELPDGITKHKLFGRIWQDIDPEQLWDSHVHLVGNGANGSGCRLNPHMDSFWHPIQRLQKKFYVNASCVQDQPDMDAAYVERLLALHAAFPEGSKLILLAFDWHHDEQGRRVEDLSPIYTPNEYAHRLCREHPETFEWIASVHPYREDVVEALEAAARGGARAVKWLPPVQGMDPASPRCNRFYDALVRFRLPLLTHAGQEISMHSEGMQDFGNPLRLRRALDHGARVIVAHCASLGDGIDLDRGPDGPERPNFELFTRMMEEKRYERQLFGDVAAIAQVLRAGPILHAVLQRTDWHERLVYGSDYPLPGVMPIFAPRRLAADGLLATVEARYLSELRRFNPLLFDFALMRFLRSHGQGFAPSTFRTRQVFMQS